MSGLMSITGPAGGEPTKVGVALVDVLTGLYAFGGVLAALHERQRTGRGQRVEVSLLGSALASLVNQASSYLCTGRPPRAMGNRHPSITPYETLATADRPLVVAVGNDGQFARLCRVLGVAGVAADPRFATNADRVANRDDLVALLEQALAARGAAQWVTALGQAGVPCGLVNDVGEAFALAERLGLGPVADAGGVPQVADPIALSATPASYRLAPPALGEHTAEVLAWLGTPPPGDPGAVTSS
jgi:crotonobetainyl-CoA:carnitine CoA-transferase CaiB-like acyl-CoA transferase